MDIKLERAIIRTFKKLREMYDENGQLIPAKLISVNEVCGLFINFCYAEYGVHTGLSTAYISMIGSNMGWKIWFNDQKQYYRTEFSNLIEKALSEIEEHEFCSMWLRASFENPKEEGYIHPVVRKALKDYRGIQDTHYDRQRINQDVIDQAQNFITVTDEVDKSSAKLPINHITEHIRGINLRYPPPQSIGWGSLAK